MKTKNSPFMLKGSNIVKNDSPKNITINIFKAYCACATTFHEYFKKQFEIELRTNFKLKDKYLDNMYQDKDLYQFIDECIQYRIGLTDIEPNGQKFSYRFDDCYEKTESLDQILERIMYSAFPAEILLTFKNALDSYVGNEQISDLILSKLENNDY